MTDDARLAELLLDWEEAQRRGQPVSPEELCRECPELLGLLRERVRVLAAFDTALDLSAYADSPPRGDVPPLSAVHVPGYEILGEIGRGGMGVVYKARHLGLDRVVALKMILAGKDARPEERARFAAEARAAAKLNHPHIVHVYETGEQDGCPYYTMEYVPGGNLDEVLQGRPLPPRPAAALVETLARAVHHAHQQSIIHRDLKPANVLIGNRGQGSGVREEAAAPSSLTPDPWPLTPVKIADFGLARHLGAGRQTRPGNVVGTPAFMAPEQAAGRDDEVGPRTDVYGLGTLLYQVLTGRAPFEGQSDWQVLNQVLHQPPAPPRQIRPDIPAELEAVCLRCLAKEPAQRYPTAAALADDLRRYLDGRPVTPPPSIGARDFGRRLALAGAAALTVLLAAGGLFLLWPPPAPAPAPSPAPVRLGILRPTAGPLHGAGVRMVAAALLAIDEVNAGDKLLGRGVREVFFDLGTERDRLPVATWRQLDRAHGVTLLGCLTAQGRETLTPSLTELDALLLYPGPADGTIIDERLVWLRPTPAQSVLPVVDWWCKGEQGKKRLFLVGSDSLYPRAAFEMLRQHLEKKWPDVDVVGEEYLPESKTKTRPIVDAIPRGDKEPDLILNLLHDDATLDLLREVQLRPEHTPVVTLRFGSELLRDLPPAAGAGQYFVGSYFPGLAGAANEQFLKGLRDKYRDARPPDDLAVAAYVGVHLWARAVRAARTDKPAAVREALGGLTFDGPSGPVSIDPETGYCRPVVRLFRGEPGGGFQVAHAWTRPADPAPYFGRSKGGWTFLRGYWSRNWSGWFNPGTKRILPVPPDEAGGEAGGP